MTDNKTPFLKKDGKTPWSTYEIRKVLGDLVFETDSVYTKTKCVIGYRHEQAVVQNGSTYFEYQCRLCRNLDRIDFDEQKTLFQAWLDQNELIDGKWKPHTNPFDSLGSAPTLTYWKDSEGLPLFYKGGVHIVYGKPATFKSFFSLNLLKEADVRLWDFENGAAGTLVRLQALGIGYESANGYAIPASKTDILDRVEEYLFTRPDILVIDGFSGFADAMDINPESNNEVMSAFGDVFNPLKAAGITVIILDHLPKDASNFDYPIGAQAKRSQADVSYLFKHTSIANTVDIYVSKDRHGEINGRCEPGALPRRFGKLSLISNDDSVALKVTPTYSATIDGSDLTATDADLLEKMYNYIKENPNKNKSTIETAIPGRNDRKRKALQQLIDGGYVESETVGVSHLHTAVKELDLSWKALGA